LDRFFIITLNIPVETYNEKTVTVEELDEIFIEYFRIFIADPEKGSIQKLLKFMGRTDKSFILKSLTQDIRDYFPNIIRYLKDYYALKFKKLQKKGHLLEKFNSKIIKNDAILLSLRVPRLVEPEIVCLYNTEDYGLSFHSIEKQLVGYTGPWLMIAYHSEKNLYFFVDLVMEKRKITYTDLIKTVRFETSQTTKATLPGLSSPCIQQ
jgi:hypothetical protein